MGFYTFIVFFVYIGLIIYIFPTKSRFEYDLFRKNFRLLPHWCRTISVAWVAVSVAGAFILAPELENWDEYFLSSINLSLFVFIFSKQKSEDEFSEQLRFKSFSFSFMTFLAIVGAFGALDIFDDDSTLLLNTLNIQILIMSSMSISLLYFYITKYKSEKNIDKV